LKILDWLAALLWRGCKFLFETKTDSGAKRAAMIELERLLSKMPRRCLGVVTGGPKEAGSDPIGSFIDLIIEGLKPT